MYGRMNGVRIRAVALAAASLAIASVIAAPAASAAKAPKPGAACAVIGSAVTVSKQVYICKPSGKKGVWGKPVKTSVSAVTVTDAWVKVAKTGAMSAAFGIVKNPTDKPVTLVAVESAVSPMQVHEMAMVDGSMVMRRVEKLTIPAGGQLVLEPGGNHLMMMKLSKPIKAGAMLPVTLTMSDGSQTTFKAMGKVFHGANESYGQADDGASMSGAMDH